MMASPSTLIQFRTACRSLSTQATASRSARVEVLRSWTCPAAQGCRYLYYPAVRRTMRSLVFLAFIVWIMAQPPMPALAGEPALDLMIGSENRHFTRSELL